MSKLFSRGIIFCLAVVSVLASRPTPAMPATVHPLDDWYDPAVPVFVSDIAVNSAGDRLYVSDQITGRVLVRKLDGEDFSPLPGFGFPPSRSDVLDLMANSGEWNSLLEGDVRLEWNSEKIYCRDNRRVFGSDRWFEWDPAAAETSALTPDRSPSAEPPTARDQNFLAEAVAVLAEKGVRVRPWRSTLRAEIFSMIDQRGRAYVFSVARSGFGESRLKMIAEVDCLAARLTDFLSAGLQPDPPGAVRLKLGNQKFRVAPVDDPFTGERTLSFEPDTSRSESPARAKPAAPKKNRPALPQGWPDFLLEPKLIAEGPPGQLIYARIRLANNGVRKLLILLRGGETKMVPWLWDEPNPEDVVLFPEGFAVSAPPAWRLMGWNPDWDGFLMLGNSRYQRIAPMIDQEHEAADTAVSARGLFLLDAEESELRAIPKNEWPRPVFYTELLMDAEPLDLTVSRNGEVFVVARDEERGLRLFQVADAPSPILDLPEQTQPHFLPAAVPTLLSKNETRQTIWNLIGFPPSLVKRESFNLEWRTGQGIWWRFEPEGVILFTTDPTGRHDTAVTIQIEGVSRVRQAVQQRSGIWLLESESGVVRLDARDPTAPDIVVVEDGGISLRASPSRALYSVHTSGTSEAFQIAPDGRKSSLGRFPPAWSILGADNQRLFFRDRASSHLYMVSEKAEFEEEEKGQVTGRLVFGGEDIPAVFLCVLGDEIQGMIVRSKAPTFLLGPLPYGVYRIDASASVYDFSGPPAVSLHQPELILPDVKLVKTLDFMYQRALAFDESGNREMAKFNYDLYLSLYPTGKSRDLARSAVLRILAADERWEEVKTYFQHLSGETKWTKEVLDLMFRRLPSRADRIDLARQLINAHPRPDLATAEWIFFLYKSTQDATHRSALDEIGMPPVYRRFFESFDQARF